MTAGEKSDKNRRKVAISIIIPTLNEEFYLGNLLASIMAQTFKDFEVLVVDGNSEDRTVGVCEKYQKIIPQLSVFKISQRGVSRQRNFGAKMAKGNILLFLDADVILPFDFLEKSLEEFKKYKGDIATCVSWALSNGPFDYFSSMLGNVSLNILRRIFPLIYGWTIFVKKGLHQRIGGFDEEITFFEDSDYCKRAVGRKAKFIVIKKTTPYVSTRRVDYEGRLNMYKKQLIFTFYYLLYGAKAAQKKITWQNGDFEKLREEIYKEPLASRFKKLTRGAQKRIRKIVEILQETEIKIPR